MCVAASKNSIVAEWNGKVSEKEWTQGGGQVAGVTGWKEMVHGQLDCDIVQEGQRGNE